MAQWKLSVLYCSFYCDQKSTNCTVLESHKGDRKELTIHSTNLHKLLLTPRVKSKIS